MALAARGGGSKLLHGHAVTEERIGEMVLGVACFFSTLGLVACVKALILKLKRQLS